VQTAADGGSGRPEVVANWLAEPELAQQAIRKAQQQHKAATLAAPCRPRA
jgi:phage I-like protein